MFFFLPLLSGLGGGLVASSFVAFMHGDLSGGLTVFLVVIGVVFILVALLIAALVS